MNIKEIVGKFGGVRGLARAINKGPGLIHYWVDKGEIPEKYQPLVAKALENLEASAPDPTPLVPPLRDEPEAPETEKKPGAIPERPKCYLGSPMWSYIYGGPKPPEFEAWERAVGRGKSRPGSP